ncbi:hypothetical protein BVRB_8g181810 [Beta vulgaris subsp. vulgaris]|nr:hypothetical protein BVRB_8g181810 [Beta vulgaris subsp. vulgaris]
MNAMKISFKSKKNILALLLILALVQIFAGKALGSNCGVQAEDCSGFFSSCCPDFYCSPGNGYSCNKYPNPSCKELGESCGAFKGSCCGKNDCSGVFSGTCKKP